MFALSVAVLILFWTVKDTKPSGSAVLPILYAVAGTSMLIWLIAECWRRRDFRMQSAALTAPLALLKAAHKDGQETLTRIALQENVEAERKVACEWAKGAWEVIAAHFPAFSKKFYGPGSGAFGESAGFRLSCGEEISEMRSAEAYVEKKLQCIERIIGKYNAPH